MAETSVKSFFKQPKVFLSTKKTAKGNRPGKGGNRFFNNVGLGFKTPRAAIEENYNDKKCPFTGNVSIRGRIIASTCRSAKMESNHQMHAPLTQNPPLMTEDMHEERLQAVESLGDTFSFSVQLEK